MKSVIRSTQKKARFLGDDIAYYRRKIKGMVIDAETAKELVALQSEIARIHLAANTMLEEVWLQMQEQS